jgi:riboflavin kinase/FMN adenylyltransferase
LAPSQGFYQLTAMQQYNDLKALSLPSCELSIGSFDGIHLGHQEIIRQMRKGAAERQDPVVVLTFYPHPSVVLRGRRPAFYITSPEEKAQLLGEFGVDVVITQPFDKSFSRISAADFLDQLTENLHFRGLWVGEDFALGHGREGNVRYLESASLARNFDLHVVPPVQVDGEIVSSTRVREALRAGDVSRVANYLGRPFLIPGTVIRGVGRGRQLGIPTANLEIWDERAYPGPGVYACIAVVGGKAWEAVTNIGVRPTFDDQLDEPVVEAHLLDFESDLYHKEVVLSFVERLRDERKFSGPEELLVQIKRDIARARTILSAKT